MPVVSHLKPRIHDALVSAAKEGRFYRVSLDSTGQMQVLREDSHLVVPSSVEANERTTNFGEGHNKRTFQLDRRGWLWELILQFNGQVSSEEFEAVWMRSKIIVPRQETPAVLPQVMLRIQSAQYAHPPRQQSSLAEITYTFEAQVSPT